MKKQYRNSSRLEPSFALISISEHEAQQPDHRQNFQLNALLSTTARTNIWKRRDWIKLRAHSLSQRGSTGTIHWQNTRSSCLDTSTHDGFFFFFYHFPLQNNSGNIKTFVLEYWEFLYFPRLSVYLYWSAPDLHLQKKKHDYIPASCFFSIFTIHPCTKLHIFYF